MFMICAQAEFGLSDNPDKWEELLSALWRSDNHKS